MPPYFRFIPHPAERHPYKLAIGRARNRFAQRRLADPGWPDQTQNGAFDLVDALLHREVFENTFLHLVETVVIRFQHGFCFGKIFQNPASFFPGHLHQPLDVITHNRSFRGHRRHHAQFLEFGLSLLPGLFGHTCFFDLLLKLLHFVRSIIHVTEFFLNGLHLLIQVILALTLFHLLFHAATQAFFHLEQVDLGLHDPQEMFQTLADISQFQYFLLLIVAQRQVRSNRIGQPVRVFDTA